ncbi:BamA/TamA family outer membrane protein [Reichenbachiella ulvae]|uniref:BamA/TamA family outer membrane protein n=1 Tax=Reichenbachiella ulvae TaxID=2980104 RepID=A0ABT3CY89_9BACT|nr:BamA/TamA family outer membrane protein [Reichenbachiella ulvae]MCV9388661.1 BamA/TamA family outer membrane protein [Reichenbachiella ulvae]
MLSYRHFIFLLLLWGGFSAMPFSLCAQNLQVQVEGLEERFVPRQVEIDSSSWTIYSQSILMQLRESGYWLASLDSVSWQEERVAFYFYQGRRYDQVQFEITGEEGLEEKSFMPRRTHGIQQVEDRLTRTIAQYENHGYPFATLSIDSSYLQDDQLFLRLSVDPGMFITYDSLLVKPDDVLSAKFLSRYLGMPYGHYYDESKVQGIKDKLENLPAVSLKSISSSFRLQQAQLALDLQAEKVNYFDGILGLVPANENRDKVQLTGELNLSLKNLFKSAKQFELHWEKFTDNSQMLDASYLHPVFLGTPLDLYVAYDQLKQDTLFSNRSLTLAFDYYLNGKARIRASYENQLGNELNDASGESGNFRLDYYGVGIDFWQLDNRQFPREGQAFALEAKVGQKETRIDTASNINGTQYRLKAAFRTFHPIGRRMVLHGALSGGYLQGDPLYLNDLFRLGGLRSVRGFNENEFYASRYAQFSLEWRFYLERRSYLVVFADQALMAYDIESGSFRDEPTGVGAGMQFDTSGGSFLILYGLGRRRNEAFSFDSSKIHFGYTALF